MQGDEEEISDPNEDSNNVDSDSQGDKEKDK